MINFDGFIETKKGKIIVVIILLILVLWPPQQWVKPDYNYTVWNLLTWLTGAFIGIVSINSLLKIRISSYKNLWIIGALIAPFVITPLFFWRVNKLPKKDSN